MAIALLATGDELIQGDTLNTNSHYIAHALNSEKLPLGLHLVCSDRELDIYDCLRFLAINHNILIVTGGLGPTSDDRTRFALSHFLNVNLVEFPEAVEAIETRLRLGKLAMNCGNRQQALFPPNATLLANPNGTALGCYIECDNKLVILLPGPPRECHPMFNHFILPLLQKSHHHDKQVLKWRLFGVAESQIAEKLDKALVTSGCETGYRLETPYIECKVWCKTPEIEAIKQIVEPLVAPYIIATIDQKASEKLHELIVRQQIPMVIIDEVTGGVLQTLLQTPDCYPLLSFCEQKDVTLRFQLRGLKEYWFDEPSSGLTQLTIQYTWDGKQFEETHEIPYYSSTIVYYAAEWLSFRLFHLINQLHQ